MSYEQTATNTFARTSRSKSHIEFYCTDVPHLTEWHKKVLLRVKALISLLNLLQHRERALLRILQTDNYPRNIDKIMLLKSQQRQRILEQNKSILQLIWMLKPFRNCIQIQKANDEFTRILVQNGYFLSRGREPEGIMKHVTKYLEYYPI